MDVDRFLQRNRREFEQFLAIVFRELGEYRDVRRNSSPIYRIYTRADKQIGGEKLKSHLGIAKKLAQWRDDNKESRRIIVNEIHDIIGVTVVTYFESDVVIVANALGKSRFKTFSVHSDALIERADYNARHIVVRQNGKGFGIGGVLCEIQIKSLLHDSWSTRTHDIYKDQDGLPDTVVRRVGALTSLVKALEIESDLLREELQKEARDDGIRRDAAALQLFYGLTQKATDKSDDLNSALAKVLIKERAYFADCAFDDPVLVSTVKQWESARQNTNDHQAACRFIAMLALLRTSRDFDEEALGALDLWVDTASQDADKANALSLRALSNWALGRIHEAVSTARELVQFAQTRGLNGATAKCNLSYYLAELYYEMGDQAIADEVAALEEAFEMAGDDRQLMSLLDSRGAVKIMTGASRSAIFDGLRMCEQAHQWSTSTQVDQNIFQLFYELHEHRAVRRLQSV